MIRRILVGLDGSPYSNAATELGIQWAKRAGATLVGLGIVDEPTIRRPQPTPLGAGSYKKQRDETLLAEAQQRVDQFQAVASKMCQEAGVAFEQPDAVGRPSEQIQLEAQRYDLILLGKQTYYHFETEEGADETLHEILKQSPRPVVTIPERLGGGNSVVVAYDGSLQAARTLQLCCALRLDQLYEAVHVVSVADGADEGARNADIAIDYLASHSIAAQRHVEISDAVADTILEQTARLNAGLLVMGAYGRSGLRELFFGSLTDKMLREKTVPLFLYH